MQNKPQELALWGMFYGVGHGKYVAQRVDDETVRFEIGAKTYDIGLSQKADAHTALVGFDGFFLRHGLARGTVVAKYTYGDRLGDPIHKGPESIGFQTKSDNVRHSSDYEEEEDRKVWDYYLGKGSTETAWLAHASPWRSRRHFLAVPKSKDGTRKSLICQLKPRSLERRYILVSASPTEVFFETCNSY